MHKEQSLKLASGNYVEKETEGCQKPLIFLPNWTDLLRSSENKKELFLFLTDKITGMFYTSGGEVKVNPTDADVTRLYPCYHEEAETRIFIHVGTHLLR